MALRLFLLSLVGLLSFELPTGRDVQTWTRHGRRWVNAGVADLSNLGASIVRSFEGTAPLGPEVVPDAPRDSVADEIALMRVDHAFEVAMDGLAIEFRSDLSATEAKWPVADEAPPRVAAIDDAPIEAAEPVCFDREVDAIELVEVTTSADPVPSADRLISAVRLTREAFSAWASFLEDSREATR